VGLGKEGCHFCFESAAWGKLLCEPDSMIVLDKVFRQKDSGFLRMLNELRRGVVGKYTQSELNKKVAEFRMEKTMSYSENGGESGVVSTKLFANNKDVNALNAQELMKLPTDSGKSFLYEAHDEGNISFFFYH
jgi:ATP-dependent DNA helicase PIF1